MYLGFHLSTIEEKPAPVMSESIETYHSLRLLKTSLKFD
jgi:hypothetical protein